MNFSHYSLPSPNLPLVTQNVRWMLAHNARGIMLQGAYQSPGSARGPLRSWVWAKQLWNPELGTRALIRDFTYGFYGSAAEPVQRYNELLRELWEQEFMGALRKAGNIRHPPDAEFLTRAFARKATALFEQAETAARDPETLRRVKLAKFSLLYLKLSRGVGFVEGENYAALCDEFEAIAETERVTHLWEGRPSKAGHVAEKLAYWRGLAKARDAEVDALRIGPDCMFRPDPEKTGTQKGWYRVDLADLDWARIRCGEAGGWNKQGFPDLIGDGWYRIRFDVPKDFGKGKRIRLYVGAADEDAVLYLNGKRAFEHTSASTGLTPEQIWNRPFLFDPTPFLRFGGENLLAVRIHNRLGMGGLWKPLFLVASDREPDPNFLPNIIGRKK